MGGQSGDILCAATIEAILSKDIPRTSGLRRIVVDQCHYKSLLPETTFGARRTRGTTGPEPYSTCTQVAASREVLPGRKGPAEPRDGTPASVHTVRRIAIRGGIAKGETPESNNGRH